MSLNQFGPPPMPRWLLFLRIAILALSLGVLIAAAYNISLWQDLVHADTPAGFLIFDAIFTFLILGCMLAFELFLHRFYYRLAFLVLLGLDCIFYLAAWSWAASWAGRWMSFSSAGSTIYDQFAGSIVACAVLGAFTWVLLLVLVYFFVRACLADPDGLHTYGHREEAELGQRKPEGQFPGYGEYPAPPQEQRYT
jgi:hypothetical protein